MGRGQKTAFKATIPLSRSLKSNHVTATPTRDQPPN
jgi:hypothetical protein